MFNQFKETYNNIVDAIGYTEPLSYDDWVALPDEHKVGALFVQFYEQIYLAWLKTRTDAAIQEECVSEVLAYLTKNVYGDFVNKLHNQNKKVATKMFSKFKLMKQKNGIVVSTKLDEIKSKTDDNKVVKEYYINEVLKCSDGIKFGRRTKLPVDSKGKPVLPNLYELTDFDLINLLPDSEKASYVFDINTSKISEKNFKPSYFYKVAYNCIYCKSIDYVKIPTTWYNNTCSNITTTSDGTELDMFDTIVDKRDVFDDAIMSKKFWDVIESQDDSTKDVIIKLLSDGDMSDILKSSSDIITNLRNQLSEFRDYFIGA